jgi:transcriptional regulator with XRE-family HTH domain
MGMKRKDLAHLAGLSYPYVSEIENGHKEPSAKALRMLSTALALEPGTLLDLAGRVADESDGSVLVTWDVKTSTQPSAEEPKHSAWAPFAPRDSGLLDRWLHETVRRLVKAELDEWVARELPDLVRGEIRRLGEQDDS